jgi:hypothetical protein
MTQNSHKDLTEDWDPVTSTGSDQGVVVTPLLARARRVFGPYAFHP